MFLKNYTSDAPAHITISRIEQLLIKVGCSAIAKSYSVNGEMTAVIFELQTETLKAPIRVRMPADVTAAQNALFLDYADGAKLSSDGNKVDDWNSRKNKTKASFREQAERTAWKLVQDWIEVQISMIQLKQADPMQVFLPYAWDGKQTFYDRIKGGGFVALMPPKDQ